jgi:hypothetical protein
MVRDCHCYLDPRTEFVPPVCGIVVHVLENFRLYLHHVTPHELCGLLLPHVPNDKRKAS